MLHFSGISESPITTLSDPRGHHAFTRALLLAGLELPCDAGRLQCRSSTKRGERRGGIASGPEAGGAPFLSGVSPLPGSRPRLSMYAAPDMGPFSGACAAGFVSLAEKSSLEKNLGPFCCHKNTSFILTCYFYWDTELAAKKCFQNSTRLEKGAVFSAIETEWMAERYKAPTSSRSSSANEALTALAAADLSSRGSSPLPRRRRPPTSPPLQENPMHTRWTRGAQPHSFQKRARATLARLELAA